MVTIFVQIFGQYFTILVKTALAIFGQHFRVILGDFLLKPLVTLSLGYFSLHAYHPSNPGSNPGCVLLVSMDIILVCVTIPTYLSITE